MADVSEAAKASGPTTRKSKRKLANKDKEEQPLAAPNENGTKDDKGSPKADSPSRSTSSPDPNCAICLSKLENKSFTDSCFHMFCFVCLLEWSKIKAECPLCKQPFKSIIHNVRSYDDYDQYHLERPENQFSYDTQNDRRFRYRTTMTHDHMFGYPSRRSVANLLTTTLTARQHNWRRRRQTATSDFRRRVYINGMRVVGLRDSSGRSRNISPEFFASNPATMHRLVPWLNRELNALLYNREEHVQFVLELILDLIKRFPIQSDEFYQHVYPFVGRHTRHFMHEFETFAKSPFYITSFDQKAMYEQQPEFVSDSDSVHSNGNDSDVMIVSPSAAQRPGRDPGAVRQHNPRTEITPVSVSLRDLLEEEDEPVTAHSGWESPIPGPSWHLNPASNTAVSSQQPGTSLQSTNNQRKRKTSGVKVEGDQANSAMQGSDSHVIDSDTDSGSDVMCVGYDKPWQERTPVIVSTDTEEDKMIEKAKRRKVMKSKKEDGSKKRRDSKSRSRSRSWSRRRARSRSSSRSNYRRSRSRSTSRSYYQYKSRSKSQRSRSRSKSSSHHRRYRSPSPYSRSKHKRRDQARSIAYEDAFGYSRRTAYSPERSRRKNKHDHHRRSHYSDSSRSRSQSPSKRKSSKHKGSREARNKQRSRSSSSELMSSKHSHKKHKKHKRSKDSNRDKQSRDNVHYKIVNDKGRKNKGDPLLSITIKRDKSEDDPVVSSTVDTSHVEIEMPENVVIRTEPITPPRPGEAVAETSVNSNESGLSTSTEKPETEIPENQSKPRKEDSDSSNDCVEVRRKQFKKHPSGHKKSRRPLSRIPDPSTSTVTSSTSQSEHQMPVLDVISQLFHGFNSSNITSTQVSQQDSILPGMMENFFDSRLSHLYGYSGSGLSDFLPRSTPSQVTSSDHPLVLSSSDDSDVVVESVMNGPGQGVSSTSNSRNGQGFQGIMYNILDSIPIISEDINSHKSVDVQDTIDVEELDNDSMAFPSNKAASSVEVIDSADEIDVSGIPSGESKRSESTKTKNNCDKENTDACSSLTTSQEMISGNECNGNPSSNSRQAEGTVVHGDNNCDENQLVDVETCDSIEPSTSAEALRDGESAGSSDDNDSKHKTSTEEETMDIDVTGLPDNEATKPNAQDTIPKNQDTVSEESMEIDVVGGVDASNSQREQTNVRNVESEASGSNESPGANPHDSPVKYSSEEGNINESLESDCHCVSSGNMCSKSPVNSVAGEGISDCDNGVNVSSSSQAQAPKMDAKVDNSIDQNHGDYCGITTTEGQEATEESSESEGEVKTPKRQIIEGASEISSEEDSIVQMNVPNVIADASDISSDEVTFDEDSCSVSASLPQPAKPQQVDDTSSDEGEISSDSDIQAEADGALDVSSDNISDSSAGSSSFDNRNISQNNGLKPYQRRDSAFQNQPSSTSNYHPPVTTSRESHFQIARPSTTREESRSSGELSDDNSEENKVYDDISSSENFDSADSPDQQVDSGHEPCLPSSSAGHIREESLSEGEIVSD